MPNPYVNTSTKDILTSLEDGNVIGAAEMLDELRTREIKEWDADDNTQVRGGIRPGHAPILP